MVPWHPDAAPKAHRQALALALHKAMLEPTMAMAMKLQNNCQHDYRYLTTIANITKKNKKLTANILQQLPT